MGGGDHHGGGGMWKEISVERADTLTCHLLRDRKSFRWSVLTSAPFACVCKPRKEDLRQSPLWGLEQDVWVPGVLSL